MEEVDTLVMTVAVASADEQVEPQSGKNRFLPILAISAASIGWLISRKKRV